MKKVFTTSILAAAVALSFGASAATISSTPLQMSAEGVAQDVEATNQLLTFDIVVSKDHPAASTITLTFDAKVDLDDLAGGAVTQSPANGKATAGDVAFDYGTGSFTFDNVVVDSAAKTIKFDVNLGNPLTANSAFRVTLGNHTYQTIDAALDTGVDKVDISGASVVAYSSATSGSVAIETGTGVISETTSQFSFAVTTEYDQLIDRTNLALFNDATDIDQLQYTFSNNETLAAKLTVTNANVVFEGDFTGLVAVNPDVNSDFLSGLTAEPVMNADDDELLVAMVPADVTADGTKTTVDLDFDKETAVNIPETGAIKASLLITASNGDATEFTQYQDVAAGEWRLDASIVNVPYLPVGYGLSPNVEIANEMTTDSDIQIRAFDQYGTEYPLTLLPFQAEKKTVTKVSEADIQTALGLASTDKRKLSVTFVIDADAEKVTLAPYYKQNESRVNVMSDQYKADAIR